MILFITQPCYITDIILGVLLKQVFIELLLYLSQTIGRPSCCMERREEHGCRGGGAIGAALSWELLLCDAASVFDEDEDAESSESIGQTPARPLCPTATATELDGAISGPTAPWGISMVIDCSASSVGEDGGDGRSFFLLDSSFSRPFFSL